MALQDPIQASDQVRYGVHLRYDGRLISLPTAHAKGILLGGTFTPTEQAKSLSAAKHFNDSSTPVLVRFSNSTGLPEIPDTDPNTNPHGFAIRFHLGYDEKGRRVHTDIVAHSTAFFPSRTGEDFLHFFQAIVAGKAEEYLASHPKAAAFVQDPKPTPSSFAREKFFGVNAFKFVNTEGKETYVRYRIVPEAGEDHLDDAALKEKGPNFLFEDVPKTLEKGPIGFKILAQIAEPGDVTNDATVHWPEGRKIVELGTVTLDRLVENDAAEQKRIIFDPVPRVKGVEPSDDPLLDVRAGVYLLSGRERRAA